MLMPVDAKTFIFKIIEPESNLMTSLSVSLEEALTEKQLATLNRTWDEMVLCPEQLIVADDLLLQMGWIHLPDWVQNMDLHIV